MKSIPTPYQPLLPLCAAALADPSACLPDLGAILPAPLDGPALLDWASSQRLSPILYYLLKDSPQAGNLPPAIIDGLREEYYRALLRNEQLEKQLNPVLLALTGAGVKVIPLKGAALARSIYPRRFLRPMVDLDLWVQPGQLELSWQILLGLGYDINAKPLFQPLTFIKSYAGEVTFQNTRSDSQIVPIDLHWLIDSKQWTWYPSSLDEPAFWKSARPLGENSTHILQLSPEDTLLHLCLHAAIHHAWAVPAISYLDIDQLIRLNCDRLDWDLLAARARAFKVTLPLYFGLYFTQQYCQTPLPPLFLTTLKISRLRDWLVRKFIRANQGPLYERSEPAQWILNLLRLLFADHLLDSFALIFKIFFPGKLWLTARYNLQDRPALQQAAYTLRHPIWLVGFALRGLYQAVRPRDG